MSILVYLFFRFQLFIALVPQTAIAIGMFSYQKLANFGASSGEMVSCTKKSTREMHTIGPTSNKWKA